MFKYKHIVGTTVATVASLVFSNGAFAVTITNEDFEAGAAGWNNNTTTLGNANFSRFLGRFSGQGPGQTIFKTYALSGAQTQVAINFDFYEIDSWDDEAFRFYVDNVELSSLAYSHNRRDTPGGIVSNLLPVFLPFPAPDNFDIGFFGFADQTYRYSFNYATTGSVLKLGFGAAITGNISNDESWGIDNVRITDDVPVVVPPVPAPVAEPAGLSILGLGLLGLGLARRRWRVTD